MHWKTACSTYKSGGYVPILDVTCQGTPESMLHSRAPNRRANPLPPHAMTLSWFQRKIGLASGTSIFIQFLVVCTRHS